MPGTTLEQIGARLRSTSYGNDAVDRLARDLAAVVTLRTSLPSYRRGLTGGVLAGVQGGTTLDVGDPAAGRTSVSLQLPQRGYYSQQGGVSTRMQGRAEIDRRTLPGVVVSSVNSTDTIVLTVFVPSGQTPTLGIDPSTGQNTATTPAFDGLIAVSNAAKTGSLTAAQLAQTVEITVPRPAAVDGHQPVYNAGEVIDVTSATQYDVRTHWVNQDGRRMPIISRREASASYALASPPPCCDTGGGGGGGS